MTIIRILVISFLAVTGFLLFDQLCLWMERRGWIYWRKKKSKTSVLGSGALALQDIFESGKATHTIEVQESKPHEHRNAGPDPK